MKSVIVITTTVLFLLATGIVALWAGQNAGAGIRIDLDWNANGNQNKTYIDPPPAIASYIYIDIYVVNASNLDTYELNLLFDQTKLQYNSAIEDAWQNDDQNVLKKNGGTTVGWTVNTSVPGTINIANTLVGNDPAQAPEGEGLLASVKMKVLAWPAGSLSFGDVHWYDNGTVHDLCSDKGDASLPVELSLFEALPAEGQVLLKWTTESEVNSLGFNIHRSLPNDTTKFLKVNSEMIKAAGNSTSRRDYSYLDRTIENGDSYLYKLECIDVDGKRTFSKTISVKPQTEIQIDKPTTFALAQSYPNPFNPYTSIIYTLPEAAQVGLRVFNLRGELVKTLVDEEQYPGVYPVQWDGTADNGNRLCSGLYFYVLEAGDFRDIKKIVLAK